MLSRVQLPPEFFAEVFGLATDTFQVVEVSGRDAFQLGAEPRHREGLKAVLLPCVVQVPLKESHQFSSLRLSLPPLRRLCRFLLKIREYLTDRLHGESNYVASMEAPRERRRATISS